MIGLRTVGRFVSSHLAPNNADAEEEKFPSVDQALTFTLNARHVLLSNCNQHEHISRVFIGGFYNGGCLLTDWGTRIIEQCFSEKTATTCHFRRRVLYMHESPH